MTERPIIFSGDMVRAILDGRKTQTRRVMKPQPSPADVFVGDHGLGMGPQFRCSYGQSGDRLWVRETWACECCGRTLEYRAVHGRCEGLSYRADGGTGGSSGWRSPIHMPRWASRLTLDITEVRVQRVQEISEEDAVAEGVDIWADFRPLWDSINAKRGFGWDVNPWVWALTFKPVPPAGGTAG